MERRGRLYGCPVELTLDLLGSLREPANAFLCTHSHLDALRQLLGDSPNWRLKARLNAASDS
jgi:hypothetical protein